MKGWALGLCPLLGLALLAAPAGARVHHRARGHGHRRGGPARAVPPLTREGLPNVQAGSALVWDMDSGEILFGKNPDRPRYIASTSKLYVAMAVRRHHIDLDGVTEITPEDAQYARGGARTHLQVGQRFKNGDLLRAMLIASDNRAVTALGRGAGMTPDQLVAEMNAVGASLGLKRTHFTDPTGLNGNTSTARDMAVAIKAALGDPALAAVMSTRQTSITSVSDTRPRTLSYNNTNRVLQGDRFRVLGGKTGYTDKALYCLVTAVEVNGRKLAFVILHARGKLTRYGDFNRLIGWLEPGKNGQAVASEATVQAAMPDEDGEGEAPEQAAGDGDEAAGSDEGDTPPAAIAAQKNLPPP